MRQQNLCLFSFFQSSSASQSEAFLFLGLNLTKQITNSSQKWTIICTSKLQVHLSVHINVPCLTVILTVKLFSIQIVAFRLPQTVGKSAQIYLFVLAFLSIVQVFCLVLNRILLSQHSKTCFRPTLSSYDRSQKPYYGRDYKLLSVEIQNFNSFLVMV